jgi:aspartate 1-decarboxylase
MGKGGAAERDQEGTSMRIMLKSKIHRVTVTGAAVNYEGSVTLGPELMRAADILPYEQVHVVDVNNDSRLVTHAIEGTPRAGEVVPNGRCRPPRQHRRYRHHPRYRDVPEPEAAHKPRLVYVDAQNQISRVSEGTPRLAARPDLVGQ